MARDDRALRLEEARSRLRAYLKRTGLRATRQRDAILEAFLLRDAHVSVDELYDQIRSEHPSIGHATVYRSMNLFVDAGIANERRFHEERVRYEPGINVRHHDHLVCLGCGDIQEFEDSTIEQIQTEVAGKRGFQVQYHRLELYGRCAKCRNDDSRAVPTP